jgi:uncharacterized protein YeaO (DUF488 family)
MAKKLSAKHVRLKRAYEPAVRDDGKRILIDRLWPRGIRKADAAIERWIKELSPSPELRRWFGHEPKRWEEFRRRYVEELHRRPKELAALRALAQQEPITLVYAAHDEVHNDAVVLRGVLLRRSVPAAGTQSNYSSPRPNR